MTIDLPLADLIEQLTLYLWPFVRIGAFLMVMPIIGGSFVPTRVRLLLGLALTVAITPVVPLSSMPPVLSLEGLVAMTREVAVGVVLGFLVQLVFDAIALGGQVIGMSMGLGFAVFLDRARGVNIPVLGQLFLMLGMLVFLSMNGHLALIELLARSFHAWPSGTPSVDRDVIGELLNWSAQLFVFAVKIALPAITAILVVNLAFGAMSRAAPTLNLFAVGFPVSMLLGFAVIFLNMDTLQENVQLFLQLSIAALSDLLEF